MATMIEGRCYGGSDLVSSAGFSKLCFLRQGEAMQTIQPGEVVHPDSTSKVQAEEWISAESWKLMMKIRPLM